MTTPITREELIEKISDPDQDLSNLSEYLTMKKDPEHGIIVTAENDHLKVDEQRDNPLTEGGVAFDWIVKAHRKRRHRQFERWLQERSDFDIVLLDGDSWAQHPFVDEIFDHLANTFNVHCNSLAGRTMQELHDENCYVDMLRDIQIRGLDAKLRAILLSGGGNDLFGTQMDKIIKPFDSSSPNDPAAHINHDTYNNLVSHTVDLYSRVISKIRLVNVAVPIILHTYSYLNPWDVRWSVIPKDLWVGDPMRDKGIHDLPLQIAIVKSMVDDFHHRLQQMIDAHEQNDGLILVDNRTLLPHDDAHWSDEIHPSSKGFKKVADSLLSKIPATGLSMA